MFALLITLLLTACGGGGGGGGSSNNGTPSSNNTGSSMNNSSASNPGSIASSGVSTSNLASSVDNVSSTGGLNGTGSSSSIVGSAINISSRNSSAASSVDITLHQITLIAAPISGGTVDGGGEYEAGASVTVTAVPTANFKFVNWKESGVVVSTNTSYTFKAESNRSLVANFVMEEPTEEEGWSHSFDATGESGGTSAREVAMDSAGNIYVAGVTTADLDGTYGETERHYYVAKYNSLGVQLYLKQFPAQAPTNVTNIEGLATDGEGNLYLLRMAVYSGPVEQQIPIVHKFNPAGEELEQFSLAACATADLFNDGSTTAVFAVDLAIDAEGNLFVAGDCWLKDGSGRHYFLAKYDPLGQRLAFNQYTSDLKNVQAVSLTLDAEGNVYVVGITFGGLDGNTYKGGSVAHGGGTGVTYFHDGFVAKFDNQGTKLYTRQFGSGGSFMDPADIAVDGEGNISIAGGVRGSIEGQPTSGSYQDFLLVNYDNQGELQYARQFGIPSGGGSAMTSARAVDTDPEGNIYIVGDTSGSVLNAPSVGEYDSFLLKYTPEGELEGVKMVGTPGGVMFGGDLEVDAAGNVFTAFESVDSDSQNSIVVKKEVGPWTLSTNPDPGGEEPDPVLDWKDNWLFVQSDKAVQYRLAKVGEEGSHHIFRIQYRVNSSDDIYTPASNGYHLYRLTDSGAQYRVDFPASFTGLNTIYELPDEIALFVDGINVSWDSVTNELVYHDAAYRPSGYTSCVDDNSSTSRCEGTYGWINDEEVINYIAE
jgi:hypothetical protein